LTISSTDIPVFEDELSNEFEDELSNEIEDVDENLIDKESNIDIIKEIYPVKNTYTNSDDEESNDLDEKDIMDENILDKERIIDILNDEYPIKNNNQKLRDKTKIKRAFIKKQKRFYKSSPTSYLKNQETKFHQQEKDDINISFDSLVAEEDSRALSISESIFTDQEVYYPLYKGGSITIHIEESLNVNESSGSEDGDIDPSTLQFKEPNHKEDTKSTQKDDILSISKSFDSLIAEEDSKTEIFPEDKKKLPKRIILIIQKL